LFIYTSFGLHIEDRTGGREGERGKQLAEEREGGRNLKKIIYLALELYMILTITEDTDSIW
jgi:hypothetical protein